MARLYCEAEINETLERMRNPSEETKLESPYGVRLTLGIIQMTEYLIEHEYLCDRCNRSIEPGQQAILIEWFNGWKPPKEKYPTKFFKPRSRKEEIILYGDPAIPPRE